MSDVVIKVENLSKKYRLGLINHGMLSKDLQSWWARVRGKDDPNMMVGVGEKNLAPAKDEIYALKDINFEVRQGEVLGIIGANGAGKSTLLKILSRVTAPTTGTIKIKGRIGSLLEVGTGFHPELTGRENIYLNGAILGMRRWEIDKKLDEIVDFSGVEKFIDTPVKRYSSGMYVRLAFAVAAHLDPEILVVDEVLAVGDAEFQKKCLGKMGEVSEKDGKTVLFVSHNMGAVRTLCKQVALIQNGRFRETGNVEDVIMTYFDNVEKDNIKKLGYSFSETRLLSKNNLTIQCLNTCDSEKKRKDLFFEKDDIFINLKILNPEKQHLRLTVHIENSNNVRIYHFRSQDGNFVLNKSQDVLIKLPEFKLSEGIYFVSGILRDSNDTIVDEKKYAHSFNIKFSGNIEVNRQAVSRENGDWKYS